MNPHSNDPPTEPGTTTLVRRQADAKGRRGDRFGLFTLAMPHYRPDRAADPALPPPSNEKASRNLGLLWALGTCGLLVVLLGLYLITREHSPNSTASPLKPGSIVARPQLVADPGTHPASGSSTAESAPTKSAEKSTPKAESGNPPKSSPSLHHAQPRPSAPAPSIHPEATPRGVPKFF